MSGTSLDGIDVAQLRTDGEHFVDRGPSHTYPYDAGQRARLIQALEEAKSLTSRVDRPGCLEELEKDLTDWHAAAVQHFCREAGVDRSAVDVIGFHGQTVLHRPAQHLTVQLGDGGMLARELGRPVVNDFRAADVAAGGEGAPLVPVYHQALAASIEIRPVAFLNIGGVANVTWVGEGDALLAFDTGPGNALINDWVESHTGAAADYNGAHALAGRVDENRLHEFMSDQYFCEAPPKSIDRMRFSLRPVKGLSLEDGAATLTLFTARSIAAAIQHFPQAPKAWIVCGGGRRNPALLGALEAEIDSPVMPAEAQGLDGDSLEAEAFAYLAVRSLRGLALSYPSTTRVSAPTTGGVLHTA
jgi:anhydro-N-acetylmuramic acid kinase